MSGSLTQSIQFTEIPADWRVPGTFVEIRPNYANTGAFAWPTRVLLVGHQTSAGTASANAPQRVFTAAQAKVLFGAGSMLAQMCAAFLLGNPTSELWATSVAEPTGSRATMTVTFTGTPSATGLLGFYFGGERVQVAAFATDTPTTLATRVVAAIAANPDLAVTAANTAGVVTVSARHLGVGGRPGIVALNRAVGEATPPGLGVSVAPWTEGVGDPDYGTLISAIASDWYTDVVVGLNGGGANFAQWTAELTRRYTAMGRLDMHAFVHLDTNTYSGATAAGQGLNSPQATLTASRGSLTPPWIWAAATAAVAVQQLTNDPARQLRGLVLPGVVAPAPAQRFIESERDGLLRSGISTFIVERDGSVAIDRLITTYQTAAGGVPDTAWLDITIPKTVSRIRHDWRTYVSLTYPRSKLADDGAIAAETDPSIVTPRSMGNAWAARCRVYAGNGWIQNEVQTVKDSVFVRNRTDRNRLDARLKIQVVGNLMVFAGALEFNQ